ncbi:sulfatase [Arenibacter sp. 6A1]|uniref:sulfatase n=1 Tax=Arenibacter sp. 6A1 TaxID=2720391 RepID=UPI0014465985|nr:sulfatase [Arenibacter sp. 6A1]NKI27529.1 sulfatase [Arenibacter sp. 6A1]
MRKIVFIFLLGFLMQGIAQSTNSNEKYNVLFIVADDLTATAVSSYENIAGSTPNIDKLATEGTRYTHAYSQYPVCGPSRASLMFGYYPNATKTYGYVSGREQVGTKRKSWSQLFKDNGYYTARVSKIYHMGVPIDFETGSNGQDDAASWTERFNSQGPEWQAEGEAELVQNNPFGDKPRKGGNVMTIVKADGDDLLHSDGKTAEKAIELIRKHKKEPFFLAVGMVRPHVPFVAPKSYFEPFPHSQIVLPPKVQNDWDDIPARGINYVTSVNGEMTEEQEKKAVAAYYASVSYMDAQVGKILNTLKEEGLEDNTIVIFTSDHGFHLGEHRFWMKVSLHEESVRVPLIIKMPGKEAAVCHSFTELLDLYPTVSELAGLKYSKNIQGKSIANTLDNPLVEVRDMAFSVSQGGKSFLIRTKKWAYIQYDEDAGSGMELFDMEYDPKQYNNLAYNPQYAEVRKEMQSRLRAKLKEVRNNDLNIQYGVQETK